MKGKLYLIPNLLGDGNPEDVLPMSVIQIVRDIRYFVVEDIRTARRFLAKIKSNYKIDDMVFYELNEHTSAQNITHYLEPSEDHSIGVISEAGVPGVADPGADIVRLAHLKGVQVVPLVGPSSILLAVMASGLNGQNFAFNGYLPAKKQERSPKIKFYEKRVYSENQTQVFIETPYRNLQLFEDFISSCMPATLLTIAANITQPDEFIQTKSIKDWSKLKPEIHKIPAIFLMGK
jgi:16S rRNA (cytidine1402-2'-O)-methyltransferase